MVLILLLISIGLIFFFFFKQKTAYEMRISDWSSDVCSSDLLERRVVHRHRLRIERNLPRQINRMAAAHRLRIRADRRRRRVGMNDLSCHGISRSNEVARLSAQRPSPPSE